MASLLHGNGSQSIFSSDWRGLPNWPHGRSIFPVTGPLCLIISPRRSFMVVEGHCSVSPLHNCNNSDYLLVGLQHVAPCTGILVGPWNCFPEPSKSACHQFSLFLTLNLEPLPSISQSSSKQLNVSTWELYQSSTSTCTSKQASA